MHSSLRTVFEETAARFTLVSTNASAQLAVNSRGEDGTVPFQSQVSAEWGEVRAFFADYVQETKADGGFMAIAEVCGMNPWLLA